MLVATGHPPEKATMKYRLLPGGYIDEAGPHRGLPPTADDQVRVNFELMHRMLFGPYDLEFTQEISMEELKRRYPNAEVKSNGQ